MNFNTWTILSIIALIGLVIFYKKKAAWGGLTLGAIIGCIVAVVLMVKGQDFQVNYVKEATIVGALLGIIISIIQRIRNKQKQEIANESKFGNSQHLS